MQLPDQITSAEHAAVLPVETFHQLAVEKLTELHEKLDELPKNPFGDDTPSLKSSRQELGLDRNSDFSMFLSGGAEHLMLGALTGAIGTVAANTLDVATTMMGERADNDNRPRSAFKREAAPAAKSATTAFKQAAPAKKPAPFATSLLRRAQMQSQMKAYKKTLKKRRMLERKLHDVKEMIRDLDKNYRASGATHVQMTPDGKELQALSGRKLAFVYKADNDRYEQKMDFERKYDMPAPKMAMGMPAPAPRF